MASMLPCHNVNEVMQLSISLTGLADRSCQTFQGLERPKSIEELLIDCSVPEQEQLRNALHSKSSERKTQSDSGMHPQQTPDNAMVAVGLSPLHMYAR